MNTENPLVDMLKTNISMVACCKLLDILNFLHQSIIHFVLTGL